MALPFQAQPSRLGAGTGPDGTATLRLSPGSFHVAIAAIGYTPDTLAITLAGPIDTAFVVMLEREPRELEEVVVSSTRSWRRVEEQPLRVEVLGREEIEEKLLTTPGDISMMLNETGGLRVQTTSGSSPISRTSAGCGTRYSRLVLPSRTPDGRWTTDAWAPLDGRVVNRGVRLSLARPRPRDQP